MKFIRNTFYLFEQKGDWALYLNRPVYKEIKAYGDYHIINTRTGENCGQLVELHCQLFDEYGNKLKTPVFEEDCYAFVRSEDNDE